VSMRMTIPSLLDAAPMIASLTLRRIGLLILTAGSPACWSRLACTLRPEASNVLEPELAAAPRASPRAGRRRGSGRAPRDPFAAAHATGRSLRAAAGRCAGGGPTVELVARPGCAELRRPPPRTGGSNAASRGRRRPRAVDPVHGTSQRGGADAGRRGMAGSRSREAAGALRNARLCGEVISEPSLAGNRRRPRREKIEWSVTAIGLAGLPAHSP